MANSCRLVLEGVDDLKNALRDLPDECAADAVAIVDDAAKGSVTDIEAEYAKHRRTGDLAAGLRIVAKNLGRFGAGAMVENTSPIAFIFENGTDAPRQNAKGANRGMSPPHHVMIPAMVRRRATMEDRLAALLESKGVTVRRG